MAIDKSISLIVANFVCYMYNQDSRAGFDISVYNNININTGYPFISACKRLTLQLTMKYRNSLTVLVGFRIRRGG